MLRTFTRCLLLAAAFTLPVESVAVALEAPHVVSYVEPAHGQSPHGTGSTAFDSTVRSDAEEDAKGSKVPTAGAADVAPGDSWDEAIHRFEPRRVEVDTAHAVFAHGPSAARAPPAAA